MSSSARCHAAIASAGDRIGNAAPYETYQAGIAARQPEKRSSVHTENRDVAEGENRRPRGGVNQRHHATLAQARHDHLRPQRRALTCGELTNTARLEYVHSTSRQTPPTRMLACRARQRRPTLPLEARRPRVQRREGPARRCSHLGNRRTRCPSGEPPRRLQPNDLTPADHVEPRTRNKATAPNAVLGVGTPWSSSTHSSSGSMVAARTRPQRRDSDGQRTALEAHEPTVPTHPGLVHRPPTRPSIAGAIAYRHHAVQLFEGYAGTSDSGFRAEVEAEQALVRGENLLSMIDNTNTQRWEDPRKKKRTPPRPVRHTS